MRKAFTRRPWIAAAAFPASCWYAMDSISDSKCVSEGFAILYGSEEQRVAAEASRDAYQQVLSAAGHDKITTEITEAGEFYFAEDYHQQYLAKNPHGYCGHGGTGVSCPVGVAALKT